LGSFERDMSSFKDKANLPYGLFHENENFSRNSVSKFLTENFGPKGELRAHTERKRMSVGMNFGSKRSKKNLKIFGKKFKQNIFSKENLQREFEQKISEKISKGIMKKMQKQIDEELETKVEIEEVQSALDLMNDKFGKILEKIMEKNTEEISKIEEKFENENNQLKNNLKILTQKLDQQKDQEEKEIKTTENLFQKYRQAGESCSLSSHDLIEIQSMIDREKHNFMRILNERLDMPQKCKLCSLQFFSLKKIQKS
jgi:hypothetical protein